MTGSLNKSSLLYYRTHQQSRRASQLARILILVHRSLLWSKIQRRIPNWREEYERQWFVWYYASKSFVHVLVIIDNVGIEFSFLRYFLYSPLYCYATVYRYTSGKFCENLLEYAVPSPVTLRKVDYLLSPTTMIACSASRTTESDSLLCVKSWRVILKATMCITILNDSVVLFPWYCKWRNVIRRTLINENDEKVCKGVNYREH